MNVVPVAKETNRKWSKMNPADQIADINKRLGNEGLRTRLAQYFIDESAIEILKRPTKTREDFVEFLRSRERAFFQEIESRWGFKTGGGNEIDDDETI